MTQNKILLDSGNNEVEILEINLGDQPYGVNVLKIKQILQFRKEDLSEPPNANKSLIGLLYLQGQQVPIISLCDYFNKKALENDRKIIIVLEFNETWYGFITDNINKIHRIPWSDLHPLKESLHLEYIIGTTIIGEKTMMIIDFEKVVSNIFQNDNISEFNIVENQDIQAIEKRKKFNIVYAEDSSLVRENVAKMLIKSHYSKISLFKNGQEAYEYLCGSDQEKNKANILITDIEMPIMDGLTLCKKSKEKFPTIPVLVLSSLISKQILTKCKAVNADAALSKKDIPQVISMLDHFCLQTMSV